MRSDGVLKVDLVAATGMGKERRLQVAVQPGRWGASPEPGVQERSRSGAEDREVNSGHFIFEAPRRYLMAGIRVKDLGARSLGFEVRKGRVQIPLLLHRSWHAEQTPQAPWDSVSSCAKWG